VAPPTDLCTRGGADTTVHTHTSRTKHKACRTAPPVNSDTCCSISYQTVLRAAAAAVKGRAVLTSQLPPAHILTPLLPAGCGAAVVHYHLQQHAAPRKLCTVH